MKEIYGTLKLAVSMDAGDIREATMGVNNYNADLYELEINGNKLRIHDISVEWEEEFDKDEC